MVDLHPGALARFIRATAVLALPAERQEELLVSLSGGLPVDELALDWDAGWSLMPQWVELGWLSPNDAALFGPIDDAFVAISGQAHAELWTIEATVRGAAVARFRRLMVVMAVGAVSRRGYRRCTVVISPGGPAITAIKRQQHKRPPGTVLITGSSRSRVGG